MARQMKDSGIEWIGEISENHPLIKLKHVCRILDQYRSPVTADQRSQTGQILYDYYGASGVIDKIDGYTVDDHVMLIGEDGANLRLRNLPLMYEVKGKAWINNHAHILKPNDGTDFYYLFHALEALDINPYITGSAQPKLSQENLKNILIPMPSLAVQRKIAVVIREKCAEIDAVIERTKATIEEYKKLKQAVITEAVTKGVRGPRPMKDSGIEWIGEIAEAHPLIKLKHVCQILDQYRSPVTADQRSQSGEVLYDYYGASGAIDKIDGYTIDDHVMLIGEDGANLRLRNLPLMYEVNGKAWINNHSHILKPNANTDFYYLFYALEALDINPYITGSAQPKLNQEYLKSILIPMPCLDEQREIAVYISEKSAALDTLIAKKTALLAEMETYKKSLIYEYVTGKKEV